MIGGGFSCLGGARQVKETNPLSASSVFVAPACARVRQELKVTVFHYGILCQARSEVCFAVANMKESESLLCFHGTAWYEASILSIRNLCWVLSTSF